MKYIQDYTILSFHTQLRKKYYLLGNCERINSNKTNSCYLLGLRNRLNTFLFELYII